MRLDQLPRSENVEDRRGDVGGGGGRIRIPGGRGGLGIGTIIFLGLLGWWGKMFREAGEQYEPPTLVMFSGATRSGCGFAQSAMGPFYCPRDHKVYLDTSFFQDLE